MAAPVVTVEAGGSLNENDLIAYGTITVGSDTYATGGFALSFSGGGASIQNARKVHAYGGGRLLEWDNANQKLLVKAWATAGATVAASEITNGTSLSGEVYHFTAVGQ